MKVTTKFFICGVTCFGGDKNCNNYCNYDHSKPMPNSPGSYQDLVMEEIDMWKDVLEKFAEYVPGDKTIFEILMSKYSIKQK